MKRIRLFLALLIITVAFTSSAQCKESKETLLNDVYLKSGMKKQSEQIPAMISEGFMQAAKNDPRLQALPKGFLKNIRLSIESVFTPKKIKKAIMDEMRQNMLSEDLLKVLVWLNSDAGKKLTLMEEKASSAEAMKDQQAFLKTLNPENMSEKKQDLYRKLDKATNSTTFNTDMVMNMQLAITVAIVATLPKEQQPSKENLMEMMEKTRPQIEAAIASQTVASFLYTYRDASINEIEKYIAFSSTPAGALYNKTVMEGFKKAMLDGCFAWGGIIADILNQKPVRTET